MRPLLALFALLAASLGGCTDTSPNGASHPAGDGGAASGTGAAGVADYDLAAYGIDEPGDDPWLGDPNADIVVIAYEAPGCSNCRHFHLNTLPGIKADYADSGRIALYFLHWTIGYAYDTSAGIAMECAFAHGGNAAFWPMSDRVYDQQGMSPDDLRDALAANAATHGYDAEAALACYDEQAPRGEMEADIAAGRDRNARSSPAFFVLGPETTEAVNRGSDLVDAIERQLA